jgi:hypothetical protein
LERTPEWIELVKVEPQIRRESDSSELYNPFSQPSLKELCKQSPEGNRGTKIKTKGIARTELNTLPLAADQEQPDVHVPPDANPTLTVTDRAFNVFSTLFFVPAQTDQQGEIPWLDFLNATREVGFEPLKLYGSCWLPTAYLLIQTVSIAWSISSVAYAYLNSLY